MSTCIITQQLVWDKIVHCIKAISTWMIPYNFWSLLCQLFGPGYLQSASYCRTYKSCCSASWLAPKDWYLHLHVLHVQWHNLHKVSVRCHQHLRFVEHTLVVHMHVWWNCTTARLRRKMDWRASKWQLRFVNSFKFLPNNSGSYIVVFFWLIDMKPNWPLNSAVRQDISGDAKKKRCLTFTLFEIPTKPEWNFIIFRCLQAWSAPIETNDTSPLVTEMLPSSSSRHVAGCFVFISFMSAMYLGHRRLYFIRSNEKKVY